MLAIPCIIFAGGKSSRMGKDKALLPFANYPTLTEYQLRRLEKIFKTVYISCKDSKKFNFNANFILDATSNEVYAPTSGFIASFKYLHQNSFFVISVDSPFISQNIIELLVSQDKEDSDATIATTDLGVQPLCGIYHRSLENKFLDMQNNNTHKLGFLLKNSKTIYTHFQNDNSFLNLNNPQDYIKALTLI